MRVGWLIAGGLLVAFGVSLGKPLGKRSRHHRRFHVRRRSGFNPGYRQRQLEREMLAYMREAREMIRELRDQRPRIDAEFIVQPGTGKTE